MPVGRDVHPGRAGSGAELVDGALRHQPAGVHDPDVAADLLHLAEQVAGYQYGRARLVQA